MKQDFIMNKRTLITLALIGIPMILGFASSAIEGWPKVFDDAFITYRYSSNLALGHGITWNHGLAPTEGYTNFLLVVFLAPFIKLGYDPLLITRILSYLSAFAMAGILFAVAKYKYSCSTANAILIGTLVLLPRQTRQLSLIGLETVVYALFLLATFHVSIKFLNSRQTRTSVLLSVLTIATMLLRPEAVLLYIVMGFLYCITARTKPSCEKKPLLIGIVVVGALGLAYLAWKAVHFGQLLPNPFYIKGAGHSLISRAGLGSVFNFFQVHFLLLSILCASMVAQFFQRREVYPPEQDPLFLGFGLVIAYSVFFIRIDTLMDIHGRFMFPLLPIVIYASIPFLAVRLTALEDWTAGRSVLIAFTAIGFLLAFNPGDLFHAYGNTKRLFLEGKAKVDNSSLMQRELRIAQSLSQFPDIEKVRIAFGDAGVIAYYTNSVWLDVVGLNDGVIARTRDKAKLVDHFFSFQPDLVIHPGKKDFSWIRYGHGSLGDYVSWANDARWNDYDYVGTCKTSGVIYDLQFFVRKSSLFRESLTRFLQNEVADGQYDPFPYDIGTYTPNKKIQPTWIPRAEPRD